MLISMPLILIWFTDGGLHLAAIFTLFGKIAFWKINNLDVVVSSKEHGFVEAIQKTGVIEQAAERKVYIVKDVITYTDEAKSCPFTKL